MIDFNRLSAPEKRRVAGCKGCKFLGAAGAFGCCDYLDLVGKPRGCKPGADCIRYEGGGRRRKAQPTARGGAARAAQLKANWDTELGRRLYESGASCPEMEKKLGVVKSTIYWYAKKHGWVRPPMERQKPTFDTVEAMRLYQVENWSAARIAKHLGVRASTIYDYARRHKWHQKPGRRNGATWDTERAKALWLSGMMLKDVAAEIGVSYKALLSYKARQWDTVRGEDK